MAALDLVKDQTYISLTTFRKTGTPVATLVWAAPDVTLYMWFQRKRNSVFLGIRPADTDPT